MLLVRKVRHGHPLGVMRRQSREQRAIEREKERDSERAREKERARETEREGWEHPV
jgi:hypothetical protein